MAIRYKALTELYQETQRKVTAPAEWRQFLTSACRNYRLSFDEQLLVYAQRPDATAVLEIERWNKRFGRWVNRGANGIAVFDGEHSGKQRLKYYFDVSDTHAGRFTRPVPLWTVRPEYAPDIIEAMENSFGELEQKDDLGAALLSAAKNAVERISEEYDESDSNMILELAATDQEYAALKQQMSELKHQHPFIGKLLEGNGEVQITAQEHEILNQYFRLYSRADNMERKHIYFRGHTDCFSYLEKIGAFKTE